MNSLHTNTMTHKKCNHSVWYSLLVKQRNDSSFWSQFLLPGNLRMICSAGRLRVCMQAVVLGERTPLLQRSRLRLEPGWLCPRPDPRRVCSRSGRPAHFQGWSLTQFYSFGFSEIKDRCKMFFLLTHNQGLHLPTAFNRCPRTSWRCPCMFVHSSGSNARGESRVRGKDEGVVAGRNYKEYCFQYSQSIGQSMIFFRKGNRKIIEK